MLGRLVGALALSGSLAGALTAQVSIRVVDANGRPVPAVRVDVYGRGEILSQASSSALGVVELSAERWSEARRISLSHLGYQTVVVQIEDIPSDGVVSIEPEAIPIDAIAVDVGQLCPVVDQPEARRLWSEVAASYATDTGTRASFAYVSLARGSVAQNEIYRTDDVETADGVTSGGFSPLGGDEVNMPLDQRIARDGYAWTPFLVDGGTIRANVWAYADLDFQGAHHFASRLFGELHDFVIASTSETSTTIAFCGKAAATGPTINGSISLIPGRAFLGADWRFETGDPDEGAGGSVTFVSFVEPAGSRTHLVSSRGIFYRHSEFEPPFPDMPRTYVREVTTDVRWHLLPTGDNPCIGQVSFPADATRGGLAACVAEHWGRE